VVITRSLYRDDAKSIERGGDAPVLRRSPYISWRCLHANHANQFPVSRDVA